VNQTSKPAVATSGPMTRLYITIVPVSNLLLTNHSVHLAKMASNPTPKETLATHARNTRYAQLRASLTNPQAPLQSIHLRLNDSQFSDGEIRDLFGCIRLSFLQMLWQQRQLEVWLLRDDLMGREYALALDEDAGSGANPERYAFFRSMDEVLEMRTRTRGEIVAMIMQHVELYRKGIEVVREIHAKKDWRLVNEGFR
jgi:hypothetical protein